MTRSEMSFDVRMFARFLLVSVVFLGILGCDQSGSRKGKQAAGYTSIIIEVSHPRILGFDPYLKPFQIELVDEQAIADVSVIFAEAGSGKNGPLVPAGWSYVLMLQMKRSDGTVVEVGCTFEFWKEPSRRGDWPLASKDWQRLVKIVKAAKAQENAPGNTL